MISWNSEPGVVLVQPVIPPGLACAVSVGGIRQEVSLTGTGEPGQTTVVNLGLAHDHRLVNGREAVAFLQELGAILRDTARLMALATRS
jgi:pyruvate/2-oxoglutarate dehydrogenase complex dihydrolipoamide acyltransferase (E2) component